MESKSNLAPQLAFSQWLTQENLRFHPTGSVRPGCSYVTPWAPSASFCCCVCLLTTSLVGRASIVCASEPVVCAVCLFWGRNSEMVWELHWCRRRCLLQQAKPIQLLSFALTASWRERESPKLRKHNNNSESPGIALQVCLFGLCCGPRPTRSARYCTLQLPSSLSGSAFVSLSLLLLLLSCTNGLPLFAPPFSARDPPPPPPRRLLLHHPSLRTSFSAPKGVSTIRSSGWLRKLVRSLPLAPIRLVPWISRGYQPPPAYPHQAETPPRASELSHINIDLHPLHHKRSYRFQSTSCSYKTILTLTADS